MLFFHFFYLHCLKVTKILFSLLGVSPGEEKSTNRGDFTLQWYVVYFSSGDSSFNLFTKKGDGMEMPSLLHFPHFGYRCKKGRNSW